MATDVCRDREGKVRVAKILGLTVRSDIEPSVRQSIDVGGVAGQWGQTRFERDATLI